MYQELLTEKYRPKNLDEVALPKRIKDFLEGGIKTNLMFYGTQGSGKTSTAKLMVKQYGNSYIYINCSSETGIDTVRDKITNFCETQSLVGKNDELKVVLLDEFDGMSTSSYQALRGCIEKYAVNTRFVATCNFVNKVPDPIKSRFTMISFDFEGDELNDVKKQMFFRIKHICDNEGVGIDKDSVAFLVKHNYPDYRTIVNKLQTLILQSVKNITLQDVSTYQSEYNNVYDLVLGEQDPVNNYKVLVGEYGNKVDDVLNALGRDFIDYIVTNKPEYTRYIPFITILVAKYQNQRFSVIDPVVTMLACVFELQDVFKN